MKYIKVDWYHANPDEPTVLYSEIDQDGWERRKVYIFRNGKPGYASSTEEKRNVHLSIEPIPPISEIAANPEFLPREIEKKQFEEVWTAAHLAYVDKK